MIVVSYFIGEIGPHHVNRGGSSFNNRDKMDKRWLIGPIRPLYLGTVGDDHHPLWEAFKTWREDMHWMEWLAGLCHTAGKPTSECWGLKINMTRWNHPYSSLTWGWLNRQQNMDSQRDAILGTARRNMPPPRLTANPGVQIIRFAASFWHVVSESKETFVWKYGTQKKTSGWKLSCFSCHFENAPHFQTHSKGTHFTP